MPGLFGFYLKNRKLKDASEALLNNMADSLKHYEMYKLVKFTSDKIGLGKFEINSNIGEKIYVDPQKNVVCGVYGEIYNFSNIDNSFLGKHKGLQTEKTIQVFNESGIKTPEKMNGTFNIVIYEHKNNQLLIFNDRFGFRHFYYYEDNNIFAFAPEIKAILTLPDIKKSLDEHGIADCFNYSYHMGSRTMFKRIKVLPPASSLTVKENQTTLKTYWHPQYKNRRGLKNLEECIDTGYNLFVQSMKRCVGNNKKVIIPISGGLDSRLIIATASNLGCDITPATFGTKGCLDYKIANKVCSTLNIKSPTLIVQKSDLIKKYSTMVARFNEINYADLGLTTQYAFQDQMGLEYDCFLNGIFGGHLSFGSPYFNRNDLNSDYSDKERLDKIIQGLNGHRYNLILRKCCTKKLNSITDTFREKSIEEEWKRTEKASDLYAFRKDFLFLYNRIRRGMNAIDQNRFFYNDQLPFASYELFDFYLTLSPDLLLDHFLYKEIYKNKLPHLARIPWQSTGKNLYETPSKLNRYVKEIKKNIIWYSSRLSNGKINIIDKDKDGHPDVNFRRDRNLRKWIEDILLSDQCLERGYFERDGIKNLFQWQMRGGSGFHEISKMVTFELWARNFLD